MELLIPTLNKIIRNQDTYFVVIMIFSTKKASNKGTKKFWAKKLWGGCSKLED